MLGLSRLDEQTPSRELSLVSATKLRFMGSYSDALALPTN